MIGRLALLGATGDLAGRYLLPSLAALQAAGELPEDFRLVGAAREGMDDAAFRALAAARLAEHAGDVPAAARDALLARLRYRQADLGDPASVERVVGGDAWSDGAGAPAGDRPVAVYLALPPGLFAPTLEALRSVTLPQGSRVVLEKPFGEDLESAVALNRLLAEVSGSEGERAVFRVDHFLGLATVQNLLALRLANRVLEPAWNGAHIEQVDIVWEETLALEGRAGYYDGVGQLRDMIQNHLLQVLCVVAMEPPAALAGRDVRDRKLEVLRSARPFELADVASRTRRARYTAGRIGNRVVPAYVEEDGVDPARGTETFAEVVFELDSPRWAGTRFVVRSAKALGSDRKEVVVRFRPVSQDPFADAGALPAANELRIGLDVERSSDLTLSLTGGAAGSPPTPVPLVLGGELPDPRLGEYARVLLDVLRGDSGLSVRGDEAEEAWRLVTPVLEAWAAGRVPLEEYPAGSDGPWRRRDSGVSSQA